MKVFGIILAAGQSRRMGQDKLLLPIGQSTIGGSVLNEALQSDLDHIFIITKSEQDVSWMYPSGDQTNESNKWSSVVCQDSHLGQSYSLKCGIKEAEKHEVDAVMILLADQPFVEKKLINQLIHTFNQSEDNQFAASRVHGIAQPPVIFAKETFPILKELKGDKGAGYLLKPTSPMMNGHYVDCLDPHMLRDIDTPEEYHHSIVNKRS
ncbi:nucleotidyltransferase family protein [Alkalicoccobacillus murimartini]|uniref:Molybdenum cofactor cytidylyltransferase n=1 Tax=Alkalicoccobacillus murimartini TaxID=171685 RepID=A0ABT9YFV6_9BACI|nr:nucleotidyltransferase family protein [Alkalicoccobacillus murimartini]MDQ0206736.1 molybdenum cofactor cytidylyltransferase [Alkalicoccobacillus murimartini]